MNHATRRFLQLHVNWETFNVAKADHHPHLSTLNLELQRLESWQIANELLEGVSAERKHRQAAATSKMIFYAKSLCI